MRGAALAHYRTRANLTLKGLQKVSGISYTQISRIENGESPSPHFSTLGALAEALDISIDDIVVYDAPDAA